MSAWNLDPIFKPERIAVIGAGRRPGSVGRTVLRNLIGAGYQGTVYPVNPKYESVEGIHAYQRVEGVPHVPDLAVICTPAATVPGLVRECGEAGICGLVILSAGFREMGESGRQLEAQVERERRGHPGMRIIGPNCLGVIVPGLSLNASFAAATPKPGHVAFVSQSGALCTSMLDWALREEIGFSHFLSLGNMLDVGVGDVIDYLGMDPATRAIVWTAMSIRPSASSSSRIWRAAIRARWSWTTSARRSPSTKRGSRTRCRPSSSRRCTRCSAAAGRRSSPDGEGNTDRR